MSFLAQTVVANFSGFNFAMKIDAGRDVIQKPHTQFFKEINL